MEHKFTFRIAVTPSLRFQCQRKQFFTNRSLLGSDFQIYNFMLIGNNKFLLSPNFPVNPVY